MNIFVHEVYRVTKTFPKDELYGVTSQLRRASLSVVLNFIEGYARLSDASQRNFFRMSYASLQESKYLIEFSYDESYLDKSVYDKVATQADEIGAMLWKII